MIDPKELLGAIARGWCHPKNSGKEMDPDLAISIAAEVNALLPSEALERDAARYRYIRDIVPWMFDDGKWEIGEMDAAIDAAMRSGVSVQPNDTEREPGM
jgi:hypothetical protein